MAGGDPSKSVVIVAIPSRDDHVWKVSSEKVPHLTLMFLGENVQNLGEIEKFLGHVVDTTVKRFGLSVDRRGVLGEDQADVLFFSRMHGVKELEQVRSYLLTNTAIHTAYNSVEQFPVWVPHLTLGFPDNPAKSDTREFPISWVDFDTIALWTGDSSGPEFLLKERDDWEVSMSDAVSQILAHHGIKGMQWGVRRSRKQLEGASDDFKNASAARDKAKKSGTKSLSNKELQDLINRMNLEQQYSRVIPPSKGKRILSGGGKFAGEILVGVGKQQITKLASDQATKLVGLALKK